MLSYGIQDLFETPKADEGFCIDLTAQNFSDTESEVMKEYEQVCLKTSLMYTFCTYSTLTHHGHLICLFQWDFVEGDV